MRSRSALKKNSSKTALFQKRQFHSLTKNSLGRPRSSLDNPPIPTLVFHFFVFRGCVPISHNVPLALRSVLCVFVNKDWEQVRIADARYHCPCKPFQQLRRSRNGRHAPTSWHSCQNGTTKTLWTKVNLLTRFLKFYWVSFTFKNL